MSNNKVTDKDYLFMSAMIRSRETRLLDREKMERMLDACSFDEAAKILMECGYPDMSGLKAPEVEERLAEHRSAVFEELSQLAPEKAIIDIFRLKYDYHNIKVLVKAQGANANGEHLLSSSGRIKPFTLTEAFNNEDYRFVPSYVGVAMEQAKDILARTGNPQLADLAVDSIYFEEFMKLAKGLSDRFLTDYGRILIDSANLRTTVRTLRIGKDLEFLRNALIPGGSVGAERLSNASISSEGVSSSFVSTPLEEAAQLGSQVVSCGSLTSFEKACDNAVTSFLNRAKMVGFGLAPVAAYVAAIEGEIVSARMILTGKLAGVKTETLRARMRDAY